MLSPKSLLPEKESRRLSRRLRFPFGAERISARSRAGRNRGAARPRRDVFPFLSDALEAVTRLRELSEQVRELLK